MIQVELYTKRGCELCDEAKAVLAAVRRDIPFELREIDIESAPELLAAYGERIPLVTVDGRPAFKFRVDEAALRRRLHRASRSDASAAEPGVGSPPRDRVPMALALCAWLCTLPFVLLLVVPWLGVRIALVTALVVLVVIALSCAALYAGRGPSTRER